VSGDFGEVLDGLRSLAEREAVLEVS